MFYDLNTSSVIAGRAIKSEYLAIGTLLSAVGLAVGLSGGDKKKKASTATQSSGVSTPSYGSSSK